MNSVWEIWVDDPLSFGCVHQQVAPLSVEVRGFFMEFITKAWLVKLLASSSPRDWDVS